MAKAWQKVTCNKVMTNKRLNTMDFMVSLVRHCFSSTGVIVSAFCFSFSWSVDDLTTPWPALLRKLNMLLELIIVL